MKPFKVPTIAKKPIATLEQPTASDGPPAKKRRLSRDHHENDDAQAIVAAANILKQPRQALKKFQTPVNRKPPDLVSSSSSPLPPGSQGESCAEGYYAVLWRKFTTKKNKTWDGDGFLAVSGGFATLQNEEGKVLGKTACKLPLPIGSELSVGGKEVEVESMIAKEAFLSGRPFLTKTKAPEPTLRQIGETKRVTNKERDRHQKVVKTQTDRPPASIASTQASKGAFRTPLLHNNVQRQSTDTTKPTPRHDPNAENALVMKRPKSAPRGKETVDVVVDPVLTKHLREHQRAGVAFLYECVMGMKDYTGEGAILADEMGLGKTLQTIALLWTLLKQNPVHGDAPVIKKALIVCPVTLIQNWRREFRKWLGKERIGVFIPENGKNRLSDFTMGRSYSVMIVGYERLRMVQADLQKGTGIDIVIADEGHRLKTAQNKSAQAIKSLNTDRRIILSGTPIQNDLAEFHTMVDFVNPGLLNKYSTFKREFETPILKSQQPGAAEKDLEKGEARGEELANITGMFILRRTAEVLSKYLPPKTEYVVFCKPTKVQAKVYQAIIGSKTCNAAIGSSAMPFEMINILRKVCNSPSLLLKEDEKGENKAKQELTEIIPRKLLTSPGASGKLQVLDSLLHRIRTTTDEKVVLVSNYTSTLDVLGNLVSSLGYSSLRLDGNTAQSKRQDLVDRFNRSPPTSSFVLLLSAKAGGTGLNLIGASRLVLFDIDWNPAVDLQAMARVHRDGQKRPCYIYRMLTQGALDEKIFQRQVSKTGLADSIVDGKSSASSFTKEELRDLFTLDESSECQTHKLLSCACGGNGMPVAEDEDELDFPKRNDLATLSAADIDRDADGTEILRLDDDDDEREVLEVTKRSTPFKNANEYDWRAEERKLKDCRDSAGRAKMLSLMQYTHLDTAAMAKVEVDDSGDNGVPPEDPFEGVIEDEALRGVLREPGSRVSFVFAKMST